MPEHAAPAMISKPIPPKRLTELDRAPLTAPPGVLHYICGKLSTTAPPAHHMGGIALLLPLSRYGQAAAQSLPSAAPRGGPQMRQKATSPDWSPDTSVSMGPAASARTL